MKWLSLEELLDGKQWHSGATMKNEMTTSVVKVSRVKKTSQVSTRNAAAATWERRNQEERAEKFCVNITNNTEGGFSPT